MGDLERRGRLAAAVGVAAVCAISACGASPLTPAPAPSRARELEQAHLLLFPLADAEALLGRAVHTTPDGAWTIADARAPGCEVQVLRSKAMYDTRRQIDIDNRTTLSAGYAGLIGIEAKFGRVNRADIDITNTEILRADARGPCGEQIVDTVFVGHGKRSLLAGSEVKASVGATIGPVTPGGSTESSEQIVDTTAWSADQAYGFTFKKLESEAALIVDVSMPGSVVEGDSVQVRFASRRRAYLVVFYLDESGHGQVLWPSGEEREPLVDPGSAAVLPSPREQAAGVALRAALTVPGKSARETLITYAFAEKADFDRLKPSVGGEQPDGAAYAAELSKALGAVPFSRWSRQIVTYEIRPKAATAP